MINPTIRIIDQKELEDGSLELCIEMPQEIFDVLSTKYGTSDFGDQLIQDAVNMFESMTAEEIENLKGEFELCKLDTP